MLLDCCFLGQSVTQILFQIQLSSQNLLQSMGNQYSMPENHQTYNWRAVPHGLNSYDEMAEEQSTKTLANYYQISVYHDIPYQLELIAKHKNTNHKHILQLIHAKIKQKTIFDCSNADIIQIYTQVIHHRLHQAAYNQLQYLIIMKQVLETCQTLVDFGGGYFRMSQKMIGFTGEGVTKFWLNQHFGRHQIDHCNLVRNEQEMVKSILSIFMNRLSKDYDFNQTTISGLLHSLQQVIHNAQAKDSFISISATENRQINNKLKLAKVKRTSLQTKIIPTLIEHYSSKKGSHSKQNQFSKKILLNTASQQNHSLYKKPIKFSLSNPQPFSSLTTNITLFKKPIIRINYDSSPAHFNKAINEQDSSELDHSFTQFPKEQSQTNIMIDSINANRRSVLRAKYRKCSQITQRSEEDSQYSLPLNHKNGHYNQYSRQNRGNKKSQFFDTF